MASSALMEVAEVTKIKRGGLAVMERAKLIKVTSQKTCDGAWEFLKDVKKAQAVVNDKLNPIIKEQKSALKLQTDLKKEMLEIPNAAEKLVKGEIGKWSAERRRIVDEQNRKRQEAAGKKAEDEKQARLKQMEDEGATKKDINEEAAKPAEAPKVEEKRHIAKHDGGSTRQQWSAEVFDGKGFVTWVLAGWEERKHLLSAHMPSLNELAREHEAKMNVLGEHQIPGVRAKADEVVGAQGRG